MAGLLARRCWILADCRVLVVGGPDGLGGQLALSALLQP
jgi:hypothetical protein